ncbi:MAG: hypothetical protein P4N41_24695 [Negativicutes bacterium]|nr:hypothetical protein [Negativicutes bacterium]MDR3592870.1 hypothetical protein [Negativicutes bacterium]
MVRNHSDYQVNCNALPLPAKLGSETIYLDLRGNRVAKAEARKVMTIYRDPECKATRITLAFL